MSPLASAACLFSNLFPFSQKNLLFSAKKLADINIYGKLYE